MPVLISAVSFIIGVMGFVVTVHDLAQIVQNGILANTESDIGQFMMDLQKQFNRNTPYADYEVK